LHDVDVDDDVTLRTLGVSATQRR